MTVVSVNANVRDIPSVTREIFVFVFSPAMARVDLLRDIIISAAVDERNQSLSAKRRPLERIPPRYEPLVALSPADSVS